MKLFIEPGEITKEMFEGNNAAKYLYKRVETEIENSRLFIDDHAIDKMFVVDTEEKKIIEVILKGFYVETYFASYNEEDRNVDTHIGCCTFIDENGHEYNSSDYFITKDKETAEEVLEELLSEE